MIMGVQDELFFPAAALPELFRALSAADPVSAGPCIAACGGAEQGTTVGEELQRK